ncbi:hypothetical protein HOY80DRAFT_937977 [Tuber brumale]|nr:hypothetical protein HOY80DRAFT_937977 [Tuber brumale]
MTSSRFDLHLHPLKPVFFSFSFFPVFPGFLSFNGFILPPVQVPLQLLFSTVGALVGWGVFLARGE